MGVRQRCPVRFECAQASLRYRARVHALKCTASIVHACSERAFSLFIMTPEYIYIKTRRRTGILSHFSTLSEANRDFGGATV